MTENKTKKIGIFSIAIPLILQQFFYQLQVLVDRAFLGHVDSKLFSALGNSLFPFWAIWAIMIAICAGTTILVAQSIGAKDLEKAQGYAEASYSGNTIISMAFFFLFYFGGETIFKIMGVTSPILEFSVRYMKLLSLSLIILGAETTASSILQGVGTTKVIMYAGLVRNVLNVVLDWLLIFGNLGLPKWGIEGAAFATTLSNFIAGTIIIIYVLNTKKLPFKINFKNIIFVKVKTYLEVIRIGIPAGLESLFYYIGSLVILRYLNMINYMAVGIYTLIFSIETIPFFIYIGIAQAARTLVGQHVGEEDYPNAIKTGFRCLRYSLIICGTAFVIFILFPKQVLGIFTNDQSLIDSSVIYIYIISITTFFRSINVVIGHGIQGFGDTKWMLYGQMFGTCVIIILLSYVIIFIFKLGVVGLFISILIDEAVRSVLNTLRFWKGRKFYLLFLGRKVENSQA